MDRTDIGVSDDGAQRLARLAEGLTDDQVDALLGAAEARQDGSISRREFAKAAGALGVGGVLGGGGAAAMTGNAQAQASTTDDDPNVGDPDNRVDVFADGVDATSVSTANENNTIIAKNKAGTSLAQKVNNALQALKGGTGKVLVTPKDDGTPWQWDSELTIDPLNFYGVEIEVAGTTRIQFPNDSGYIFDIAPTITNGNTLQQSEGRNFALRGGIWESTGEPDGFVKATDSYGLVIKPRTVLDFTNPNNDCRGYYLRNESAFSEAWRFGGKIKGVDIGVDFAGVSVTGGSGTNSFQDGQIDNLTVGGINNTGFRFRGQHRDVTVLNPVAIPSSDDTTGYLFDGDCAGMTVISPEAEDPGDSRDNNTAFATGSNFSSADAPIIIGGNVAGGIESEVSYDSPNDAIWQIIAESGPQLNIGAIGDQTVGVDKNGSVYTPAALIKSVNRTIPDDDITTIDVTGDGIKKIEVLGSGSSGEVGTFGTSFDSMTTFGSANMTNEGGTALGGQAGADGSLNISRDDNTVYLENRTGASLDVSVLLYGSQS